MTAAVLEGTAKAAGPALAGKRSGAVAHQEEATTPAVATRAAPVTPAERPPFFRVIQVNINPG